MATKKPGKKGKAKTKPSTQKTNGNIEVGGRFPRLLPCPIDAAAVQAKKDRNFDIDGEIEAEKLLMEPFKEKIRKLQEEKIKNRKSVETMTEEQMVECVEQRDYGHREVRVVRLDTDAVVEKRTMNDADRSPELPNVPAGEQRPNPDKVIPIKGKRGQSGEETETIPSAGGSTLTPAAAIAAAREQGPDGEGDRPETDETPEDE